MIDRVYLSPFPRADSSDLTGTSPPLRRRVKRR